MKAQQKGVVILSEARDLQFCPGPLRMETAEILLSAQDEIRWAAATHAPARELLPRKATYRKSN